MDTYVKRMMSSEVIKTGGTMTVSSGGIVAHTCVTSGGKIEVLSGGTGRDLRGASAASSVIVRSGGSLQITSGNTAQYILGQGKIDVYSGGSLRSSLLQQDVQADVSAGYVDNVLLTDTTKSGTAYTYYPSLILSNATVASNLTMGQNGHLRIRGASITYSVASGSAAALSQDPVTQEQHNAGYIGNCSSYEGGTIYVRGLAQNVIIGNLGRATIAPYTSLGTGLLRNVTISGGTAVVYSGGTLFNCTVKATTSRGYISIASGGVASSVTVSPGCAVVVSSTGVLRNASITASGGSIVLQSGARGSNLTANVNYNSAVLVAAGAAAVFDSGFYQRVTFQGVGYLQSGATCYHILMQKGGGAALRVSGGAIARYVYLAHSNNTSKPHAFVFSGGVINSATAGAYSTVYLQGGRAEACTASGTSGVLVQYPDFPTNYCSGCVCTNSGIFYLRQSAVAPTARTGGLILVMSGVCTAAVISSGGTMTVSSAARASSPVISSGGTLNVVSGGTALKVTSKAGAVVIVYSGGVITYA